VTLFSIWDSGGPELVPWVAPCKIHVRFAQITKIRPKRRSAHLTFCLRLLLPVPVVRAEVVETLDCDTDVGDIARAGMFGGGPGSAAGDLRCIER
jgi:hypothetical protein